MKRNKYFYAFDKSIKRRVAHVRAKNGDLISLATGNVIPKKELDKEKGVWCNGNITGLHPVAEGSIPSTPIKKALKCIENTVDVFSGLAILWTFSIMFLVTTYIVYLIIPDSYCGWCMAIAYILSLYWILRKVLE